MEFTGCVNIALLNISSIDPENYNILKCACEHTIAWKLQYKIVTFDKIFMLLMT